MGKNKNGGFQNLAARRFKEIQHVPTMSESEIYDILSKDITVILDQLADYQETQQNAEGKKKDKESRRFAKYPNYTKNMFANLSTAKFMYELVEMYKNGDENLTKRQVNGLKMMLSTAYRDTVSKNKIYPTLDDDDRCKYLCEAFRKLSKKAYKTALKLTESDSNKTKKLAKPDDAKTPEERKHDKKMKKKKAHLRACEVIIQAYQDPKHGVRVVAREFDKHAMSDKNKIRILKKLYGDRYLNAMGCILGIEGGGSDLVGTVKDYMKKLNKKQKKRVLRYFAEYYKQFGKRSFLLDAKFYDKHKKLIKKLISEDIGYKKAFSGMQDKSSPIKGNFVLAAKGSSSMKAEDRVAKMLGN